MLSGPAALAALALCCLPRAGALELPRPHRVRRSRAEKEVARRPTTSGSATTALFAGAAADDGYRYRSEQTGRVDVDQCATDFPDFTAYLNRAWGKRYATSEDLWKDPEPQFGHGRMMVALELLDGRVRLRMLQVPHGEVYKRNALLKVLEGVVERQEENLRPEVARLGGNVTMFWRFMNGDCPESRLRVGLPLHGYSSDQTRADIALPDFTFERYKDIHSSEANPAWKSDAWGDVSDRLRDITKEKKGFVWRGSMSNGARIKLSELVNAGPPEHLKPLLEQVAPDGFDVTTMQWEGASTQRNAFMSLYDQCKWAYTFHVPGKHYSAMLKYKLACNQTVFMVQRPSKKREEFFYEALHHGNQIFYIKDDLSNLWQVVEEAFSPTKELPAGARAAAVAAGGRRVADTYLSQRGIDCYMMLYLKRFYFPFWEKAWKCTGDSCGAPSSSILKENNEKTCANPPFGECECEKERTETV